MGYKYQCFWIEYSEEPFYCETLQKEFNCYGYSVYYKGTVVHTGKCYSEIETINKCEEWVDDYGYEWLGVEQ